MRRWRRGTRGASWALLGRWARGEPRPQDTTRSSPGVRYPPPLRTDPLSRHGGHSHMRRALLVAPVVLALALVGPARATERTQVPQQYKWKLSDLYASDAAWNTAKAGIQKRIPALAKFQGRLGRSADSLFLALSTINGVNKDLERLYNYASMLSDQDIRVASHVAMKQSASKLYVDFGTATSYVQPEIIAIGCEKIHAFLAQQPKLQEHRMYLEDLLRYGPHTLSAAEEMIAAQAGLMGSAGEDIRDIFKNAEMPYPEIKLSNGE